MHRKLRFSFRSSVFQIGSFINCNEIVMIGTWRLYYLAVSDRIETTHFAAGKRICIPGIAGLVGLFVFSRRLCGISSFQLHNCNSNPGVELFAVETADGLDWE